MRSLFWRCLHDLETVRENLLSDTLFLCGCGHLARETEHAIRPGLEVDIRDRVRRIASDVVQPEIALLELNETGTVAAARNLRVRETHPLAGWMRHQLPLAYNPRPRLLSQEPIPPRL